MVLGVSTLPAKLFDPVRLEEVEACGLLDTGPEEAFDNLATLAAVLLDTPLAFVTVVDAKRSWFKSCIGLAPDAERQTSVEESFCQYVIGSSSPLIVNDARADPRTRDNPAVDAMGVAAWAGFPVRALGGEVLGTFCVVDTVPREWTERDARALETLSQAVSREIALRVLVERERKSREIAEQATAEAARLLEVLREAGERSAKLAQTLRESLLPPLLPTVPGLQLAARYVPAATGDDVVGDFYDVFQSSRSSWDLFIGDVCGKGPAAATLTALARYTLRAEAVRTSRPSKVLEKLNSTLLREKREDERFLTVVYGRMRRSADTIDVKLCSAGHLPPLLVRSNGTVEEVTQPGIPLGLFPAPSLVDSRVWLYPGDALVLYTDGVTEARRGGEEFASRLHDTVAQTAGMTAIAAAAHIEHAVNEFRAGPPKDDTAVLVVRLPEASARHGFSSARATDLSVSHTPDTATRSGLVRPCGAA